MRIVKTKNKISAIALILLAIFTLSSCDLKVQERFTFNPETDEQFTFGATTPWEWLQRNEQNEFNFMIAAIKATGLEEVYDNKTNNYTYIFLKDSNFTGNSNGVFAREFNLKNTGRRDPEEVMADSRVDLDILREVLLYFVVTEYVDQSENTRLRSIDVDYEYTTLSNDVNNKIITFSRNRDFNLSINKDPRLLTTPMIGAISANVDLHNYIFSNGNCVAHILKPNRTIRAFKFGEPLQNN